MNKSITSFIKDLFASDEKKKEQYICRYKGIPVHHSWKEDHIGFMFIEDEIYNLYDKFYARYTNVPPHVGEKELGFLYYEDKEGFIRDKNGLFAITCNAAGELVNPLDMENLF